VTGERRAWVEQVMGLPVSVHVRRPGPATGGAVAAVFAALREADARFSTYRPDSEISRLKRGELRPADCHPQVREVLELSAEAWRRTNGHFDVMLPGPDGRPTCDPTGLVKGWAVERAAALLAAAGIPGYYLNAGGDMVLAAPAGTPPWGGGGGGPPPPPPPPGGGGAGRGGARGVLVGGAGTPPWRVGVEDRAAPDARLVAVLSLHTGAVATSGTARRGHHIHHPLTGGDTAGLVSVTVVGPSLTWADVYATALVAGAGLDILPVGYSALLVGPDGAVTATPGMPLVPGT
jgi:thiamine biosynthesis lipoprotein